mgnify:CR=1 FL=1
MQNKAEREKEQVLRMSGVNPLKCMRCGKCSGTCPSYDEMEYHPHQFVYMVENGDIEALRLCVIRQKGANHLKADDIPALLDEDMPQQALMSAMRKYSK